MQPVKLKPQPKVKPQGQAASALLQQPRKPPTQPQVFDLDEDGPAPPRRPPPLRQMLEAYFSDNNLKSDRHLREIISASPGGWVDVDEVLELKRVRAHKPRREDVLRLLEESPVFELWHDEVDGSAAVRRAKGRPLPKFEGPAGAPPAAAPAAQLTRPGAGPGKRRPTVIVDEDAAPPDEEAAPPPPSTPPDDDPELEEMRQGSRRMAADGDGPARRKRVVGAEVKPGARFVGKVQSFHSGLGMGFIACNPTLEVYGRDIAVDKAEIKKFVAGDIVAFGLFIDPDFGTPKAVDLEEANEADLDFCVQEAPEAKRPAKARKLPAQQPAARLAVARQTANTKQQAKGGLASMRFVGEIMSYDEASGIGKISCPETFAALGRNVAVAGEELAGFEPGDRVTFALRAAKAVDLEAE